MTKTIHTSLDIQYFLDTHQYKPLRFFAGMAKKDDGTPASGAEYLAYLQGLLDKGHKLAPFGKCPGFDPQTGCPGHELRKEGSRLEDWEE